MHPTLSELPPEVLEHILSFLPPVDIPRTKQVNHLFQDVISNSQHLQHRINLFSVGLVDNPHSVFSLAHRQSRLREYVNKWESPEMSARYNYPLNNRMSTQLYPFSDQNLFATRLDNTPWGFIRIPLSPTQGTVEEWILEPPPDSAHRVVYSQDNLLAVVEQRPDSIKIHLLDLLDGSPHKIPVKKNLSINFTPHYSPYVSALKISRSRIALVVASPGYREAGHATQLIVWDWREGEVVLNLSSDDLGSGYLAIELMTAIDLLDEYWLIALSFLHLLVFDTRPGPRNPQYKILQPPPPNFSPTSYVIPTGHGDPLTVHPEFLTDPAQRNFVLRSQSWVLVIPVNLLTRVMRFVCPWSNHYISWWDWGEDVIGVLVPTNTLNMQLVDAKLLVLCGSPPDPKSLSVGVYDLSKLGQKDIQVLRFSRERRDPCKRLLSAPMWFRTLEMGDENPYRLCFIGNKVVGFYEDSGENHYLRIWEFGEM